MKLIAMSDDRWTTIALFSIAGEEYFFQHSKTPDIMSVETKAGEELDFTLSQCEDVLNELKKQRNYKRK